MVGVVWTLENDVFACLEHGVGDLIGTCAPGQFGGNELLIEVPNVAMTSKELSKVTKKLAQDMLECGGDCSRGGFGVDLAKLTMLVSGAPDSLPLDLDVTFGPVTKIREGGTNGRGKGYSCFSQLVDLLVA